MDRGAWPDHGRSHPGLVVSSRRNAGVQTGERRRLRRVAAGPVAIERGEELMTAGTRVAGRGDAFAGGVALLGADLAGGAARVGEDVGEAAPLVVADGRVDPAP